MRIFMVALKPRSAIVVKNKAIAMKVRRNQTSEPELLKIAKQRHPDKLPGCL